MLVVGGRGEMRRWLLWKGSKLCYRWRRETEKMVASEGRKVRKKRIVLLMEGRKERLET